MKPDETIIAYEAGFLSTCESRFDQQPEPSCPYPPGSDQERAWALGAARALALVEDLDFAGKPEKF